jgi:hypothetical protein
MWGCIVLDVFPPASFTINSLSSPLYVYPPHCLVFDPNTLHDVHLQYERAPLHWAAENGQVSIVTELLAGGADADVLDKVSIVVKCTQYVFPRVIYMPIFLRFSLPAMCISLLLPDLSS